MPWIDRRDLEGVAEAIASVLPGVKEEDRFIEIHSESCGAPRRTCNCRVEIVWLGGRA